MTKDEEADFYLLGLANNEKHKFAIQVAMELTQSVQDAFERGIDFQWFTLVDVSTVTLTGDRLMRVFRLTEAGLARFAELSSRNQK